jgi:hypothetical protein
LRREHSEEILETHAFVRFDKCRPSALCACRKRHEGAVAARRADGNHVIHRSVRLWLLSRRSAQHNRRTSNGQCDDG